MTPSMAMTIPASLLPSSSACTCTFRALQATPTKGPLQSESLHRPPGAPPLPWTSYSGSERDVTHAVTMPSQRPRLVAPISHAEDPPVLELGDEPLPGLQVALALGLRVLLQRGHLVLQGAEASQRRRHLRKRRARVTVGRILTWTGPTAGYPQPWSWSKPQEEVGSACGVGRQ